MIAKILTISCIITLLFVSSTYGYEDYYEMYSDPTVYYRYTKLVKVNSTSKCTTRSHS
jgi:hypothetical protein